MLPSAGMAAGGVRQGSKQWWRERRRLAPVRGGALAFTHNTTFCGPFPDLLLPTPMSLPYCSRSAGRWHQRHAAGLYVVVSGGAAQCMPNRTCNARAVHGDGCMPICVSSAHDQQHAHSVLH